MTQTNHLGVIADDFTGALDAGVEFVRAGLPASLLLRSSHATDAAVQVINTESRERDAVSAQQQVAQAVELLRGRAVFKKIDSTMRGHIGAEIMAALRATGLQHAVVCPAAIEAGRTIQDGRLYVHGELLHRTDFANDPHWPAQTADLAQLIGLPTAHLGQALVRAGAAQLAEAISAAAAPIVTVDAQTNADLHCVAQAIIESRSLPCGALGLAREWARELVGQTAQLPEQEPPGSHPMMIVAGSRHPQTIAQVNALLAARDVAVVEVTPESKIQQSWVEKIAGAIKGRRSVVVRAPIGALGSADEREALGRLLGTLTAQTCEICPPGALLLTGGATASAICGRLGVHEVAIMGELEVGVPWGRMHAEISDGALLVTKAGGFGRTETLIRAFDRLRIVP